MKPIRAKGKNIHLCLDASPRFEVDKDKLKPIIKLLDVQKIKN